MRYAGQKRGIAGTVIAGLMLILLMSAASAQTPAVKAVGTVKSVSGNSIVLTTDSGADQTVTFADSARIVRLVLGLTDLKTAPTIAISDIQVGDRVFARGQAGDGNAVVALYASVMKQSDIADKRQKETAEWQRSVGGIVKGVDLAAKTITIAISGKPVVIHLSAESTIRRYAPDSAQFDDAKPGTLDQIKSGDQVRALGSANADGTEITAQAILSGAFRSIAGTVISTDAANNTVTLTDLATKKRVLVKITADSQLHKLSPKAAMGITMLLKGGPPGAAGAGAPGQGGRSWSGGGGQGNWREGGSAGSSSAGNAGGLPGTPVGQGGNWRVGGGPPDSQRIISQIISRAPALAVSDLNKGDAVILVATEGNETSGPTAITLVSGVEPILTAAPAGTNAATILSPWNLSAPAGAGGD
jgi:hypothetical protein